MTQAVIQTTVTGMQGRPIATTVPATNQAYTWSGTAWAPTGPFLPLAGGILSGPLRLQSAAPVAQIFNDTTTSITAGGLFREVLTGGSLLIQSNTATAGDFSTVATPLNLSANGSVSVGNTLAVAGALTAGTIRTNGAGFGTFAVINPNNSILAVEWQGPVAQFACTSSTSNNNIQMVNAGNLGSTFIIFAWGAGNVIGSITNNGGASVLFNTTSDGRLKSNIVPVAESYAGATIDALTPVSFNWTNSPDFGTDYGFVAQDAEKVYPQAVNGGVGNPGDEDFRPYGMDNSKLMPLAIAELKSLRTRVAALEAKAAA